MDDPSWAQFSVSLVEAACEVGVAQQGTWAPPPGLADSLNCPDSCSGHGECAGARCVCHEGYTAHDCSYMDTGVMTHIQPGLDRVLAEHQPTADVPTPFPLVAGPQHSSVCDLASLQCASFPVLGQDFVAGPGLACSLRPVSVEDSSAMNWKYLDGPLRSPATFINETR